MSGEGVDSLQYMFTSTITSRKYVREWLVVDSYHSNKNSTFCPSKNETAKFLSDDPDPKLS